MIRYTKDTDNIVTLTLDMDERPVNVINHEIADAFIPVVRHLQQEKAKNILEGVILTSAKKSFLTGGDLEYLYQASDPEEIFRFSEKLKKVFRELESPGVPVVAAINGSALGIGFELALACHYRVVLNSPKIQLGLPEVTLGLMPGGGGIIRLMWLLGIEKAFPVLTSGKQYSPREALHANIIDDLADTEREVLDKAKAWLLKTKEGRRPWDQENGMIPGGTMNQLEVANRIRLLTAKITSNVNPSYLAPYAILNVLCEGSKLNFDNACRIESRYYTELVLTKTCKNMISTFWANFNAIQKGINRPKGFGKFRPKKVGIIGAGQMGTGIALACLNSGLEVILKDVSKMVAERGKEHISSHLKGRVQKGQITAADKKALLDKISTTDRPEQFETCDLIIEAVFENRRVKQKVTRESEVFTDEYALFATNTISIPITKLAEASTRPENYVGLHFFAPAEEVPLVEIVKGQQTSDETVARAFDFVRAIQKIPIVVKDKWGFYAARVKNTYLLEGITLLQEGFPPALIENLGKQVGMPSGALAMADALGLELVLKYEKQAAAHYGPKYIQHPAIPIIQKMVQEYNRPGKQKKAGFYEYDQHGATQLWAALSEHFPVETEKQYDPDELKNRLLISQVLEALWCIQEKVISSIEAANLGSIYGWGFPGFKGGIIRYIQDFGPEKFVQECKRLEGSHGPRFKVPLKLKKWIKENIGNT